MELHKHTQIASAQEWRSMLCRSVWHKQEGKHGQEGVCVCMRERVCPCTCVELRMEGEWKGTGCPLGGPGRKEDLQVVASVTLYLHGF